MLGASGGITQAGATTAFLLDEHILLDGGTGVGSLSLEQMQRVEALLLTHAHLDHIAGAALMLASVIDRRTTPLTIYAPADVLATLQQHIFNWQVWPDFAVLPSEAQPVLKYEEVSAGGSFRLGQLNVEVVPLSHTVPSYAYIVSDPQGKTFCFCGDTGPTQALWQRINERSDVQRLFIELSYPAEEAHIAKLSGHYDLGSLVQDLNTLKQPLELYLMHAKPGFELQLVEAVARESALHPFKVQHCRKGESIPL